MMETFDILILGGGPSGVSTALHLARRFSRRFSPSMLILEKEHYPRPKLCAGGLTLDAERILQSLNLDVNEIPHADSESIHFNFAGKGLKVGMKNTHALRIIRRNEFDAWLAKNAENRGIEIRQGVTVQNVIPDSEGVTVETSAGKFRAKMIVGADGSNGVTRRCIFPHAPVNTARALEVIVTQASSANATFDFFPVPQNIAGYTWDFPTQIDGQPARCWGIYDTNLLAGNPRPPLKEILAGEMARSGFNLNDYELKGHPIRWYAPENPISAPRILLVGDAAGADPLFGEGISMALGYGAIAAQEIENAFCKNDFSFSGYKRRLHLSGLGQTLFTRWLLTYIIYPLKWNWFQFLLWRVFQPIVLLVAWIFVLNWSKRLK